MTDAEKQASAKQLGIKHVVVDVQGKPTKRVRTKTPVKLDVAKPSTGEPSKAVKKKENSMKQGMINTQRSHSEAQDEVP
jgi:hypothetical protein